MSIRAIIRVPSVFHPWLKSPDTESTIMAADDKTPSLNFIHQIIEDDNRTGKFAGPRRPGNAHRSASHYLSQRGGRGRFELKPNLHRDNGSGRQQHDAH